MSEKTDELLEQVIKEIYDRHNKILDDWCKAYLAKEYQQGYDPDPRMYELQMIEFHDKGNTGWVYRLVPKKI